MADLIAFENLKAKHSDTGMTPPTQAEWLLSECLPNLTKEQAQAIVTAIMCLDDSHHLPRIALTMAHRLERFINLKEAEEAETRKQLTQAITSKGNVWLDQ